MRHIPFPNRCFGLILSAIILAGCSVDSDLRDFRLAIPATIAGLDWPALVPVGEFRPRPDLTPTPNPQSLAQRAAALRRHAVSLQGPVLQPDRKRAMLAALARYNQG